MSERTGYGHFAHRLAGAVGATSKIWGCESRSSARHSAAVWFTLRTVTTVGHGDDTPTSFVGRFVASGVMLVSISLFTVVTAGITSILIGAVSREEEVTDRRTSTETLARIEASLAATHQ